MPRLSVDIDVVYVPWWGDRSEALKDISREVAKAAGRLSARGFDVDAVPSVDSAETKLLIRRGGVLVKVEVNAVFRGTVLPIERRPLSPRTSMLFAVELEVPTLAADELYGSKLVAAFDRQHPRDLFDVLLLDERGGISDGMVESFVTYLAGHNRPMHEVLSPRMKDLALAFESSFAGMTSEPVSLRTIESLRLRLFKSLPSRLTDRQRAFLLGLAHAEPDWALLHCPHAAELPALRWKLANLQRFRDKDGDAFRSHAESLERLLS